MSIVVVLFSITMSEEMHECVTPAIMRGSVCKVSSLFVIHVVHTVQRPCSVFYILLGFHSLGNTVHFSTLKT